MLFQRLQSSSKICFLSWARLAQQVLATVYSKRNQTTRDIRGETTALVGERGVCE